jgi:hypothetical protein
VRDDADALRIAQGGDEDIRRCLAVRDLLKILIAASKPRFLRRSGSAPEALLTQRPQA